MAGRINDDDVKAVRDAVPIDAVVSEYLQLRSAGGGNLKGLCPFHDEKSPSFQVSPSKGLFHCFGCQEGGDTFAFVMKIDHLSFSETVDVSWKHACVARHDDKMTTQIRMPKVSPEFKAP